MRVGKAIMITGNTKRAAATVRHGDQESEMGNTMAVTDANFETEIEKASGVAVVDFWAEWCGPCRAVGPIIDQLATEYAGKVKVAKMDVDANPRTGMRFNVRSIPTILFFRDGKLVDTVIGAMPKPHLDAKFKLHIGNADQVGNAVAR